LAAESRDCCPAKTKASSAIDIGNRDNNDAIVHRRQAD
jgi:hypothetical protein